MALPSDPYIHPDHAANAGNEGLKVFRGGDTPDMMDDHSEYGAQGQTPGPMAPQNRMGGWDDPAAPLNMSKAENGG